MTDRSDKILEIDALDYRYKSEWAGSPFHALKGVSVDVRRGESFGFLGHNGAGKTTTIKCVLGLIRPTAGRITIDGLPSTDPRSRAHVGYLPEQPYFYDHLTVREILSMYGTLAGLERSALNEAVGRALERVRMTSRIDARMRTLSKGLTQRVAMAQAIVASPSLLILDEPFSGLDPIGRREFRDLMFELKSEGTAIFMSSHILDDVEYLCDRASIMSRGELKGVFDLSRLEELVPGSFELVIERGSSCPELERIAGVATVEGGKLLRYTIDREERAREALAFAVERSERVVEFSRRSGGLEDLFVRLVHFDEGAA